MEGIKKIGIAGFWHLAAGIIMVLLGFYIWFNPQVTLVALALYLGIAFILIGGGYFMASFSYQSGWYLVVGILDILVGAILFSNIGVTAASLPIIFAVWCLAVGVIQIVAAFEFKKMGVQWPWLMTTGFLGIIFAFLILAYPAIGAVAITVLMGAYVFLYGVVQITEYVMNKRLEAF